MYTDDAIGFFDSSWKNSTGDRVSCANHSFVLPEMRKVAGLTSRKVVTVRMQLWSKLCAASCSSRLFASRDRNRVSDTSFRARMLFTAPARRVSGQGAN